MSKEYITTNKETKSENVDTHQPCLATKRIRANDGRLLELPVSLTYDILSRLQLKTIFSCICVCKTFLNFHIDPYFAQVHLSRAPKDDRCLILQDKLNGSNIFFINMIDFERLYLSSLWNNNHHAKDFHLWKSLTLPTNISKPKVVLMTTLVGSCNGLVCLCYHLNQQHTMMCVCNPILGEFTVLPQSTPAVSRFSFGYCPKSKQYKVLRFTSTSICEIHTLGTDYWSKIYNVPYPLTHSYIDSSSLDGNILWITETSEVSEMICSFNLETEQYVYITPPAHFLTKDFRKRMSLIQVRLLGGLLCISYILDKIQFEVCVMKNYGVESSWTKEISFYLGMKYGLISRSTSHLYARLSYEGLHAITLLNNRDFLFSYLNGTLVYYSPRKAGVTDIIGLTWERKHEDTTKKVFDAVDFVPSFISLKNIGKAGSVNVVQRGKLRDFGLSK